MVTIKSERLNIRSFESKDGESLYEYLSDKDVVRYEPHDVFTRKMSYDEASRRADDKNFYAVCLQNGKLIGNLYFAKGDFDTWELGYVFNKHYWGNGYAEESARALLEYGFENMNVRRVFAQCNPINEASWRLLERLGMRREATHLSNVYFSCDENGKPIWIDTYEYAILKDEYIKQNAKDTFIETFKTKSIV